MKSSQILEADLTNLLNNIEAGDCEEINPILNKRKDLIGTIIPRGAYKGMTPLMVAAYFGHDRGSMPSIFKKMLDYSSNEVIQIKVKDKEDTCYGEYNALGWNAAVFAAQGGNPDRLAMILKRIPSLVTYTLTEGDVDSTLLMYAVDTQIVRDRSIKTLEVIFKSLEEQKIPIADYVNRRINHLSRDPQTLGKTALDFAIAECNVPAVRLLCQYGAKPFEEVNGKSSAAYLQQLMQTPDKHLPKKQLLKQLEEIGRVLESTRIAPLQNFVNDDDISESKANGPSLKRKHDEMGKEQKQESQQPAQQQNGQQGQQGGEQEEESPLKRMKLESSPGLSHSSSSHSNSNSGKGFQTKPSLDMLSQMSSPQLPRQERKHSSHSNSSSDSNSESNSSHSAMEMTSASAGAQESFQKGSLKNPPPFVAFFESRTPGLICKTMGIEKVGEFRYLVEVNVESIQGSHSMMQFSVPDQSTFQEPTNFPGKP